MQPAKLPPSSPQLNSNKQELDQSIEKPEKAESSWFGAVVTRLSHAIGYVEAGTGPDTALADRKISSSGPSCTADTGTQSETSITADPQPIIPMDLEEVSPALAEAVKEKDAARVQSLLASLKLSSPDQAAQETRKILSTILQDNLPSILSMPTGEYDKLKMLIDCLLEDCGHDITLANSALKLFIDREDFDHAALIKSTYKANLNLEADHLKIALDKRVKNAPYTELNRAIKLLDRATYSERAEALGKLLKVSAPGAEDDKPDDLPLYDHGKAILDLANLQDAPSLAFARNILADGLAKCLEDTKWLQKLDQIKFDDIVKFFKEFFNHGMENKELAYDLLNLCFTKGNYPKAANIAKELSVCLTDEHLANAFWNPSYQHSVKDVLELATPGAADRQIIKDAIQNILQKMIGIAKHMEPYEIENFESFIESYVSCLSGEVSDKLYLLNPLMEFCVCGNKIDLAKRLKTRFIGCYLKPQAYQEACQKVTLSSIGKTEKTEALNALFDLAEHAKSKID